jgi:TPR repeat protein
LRRAAAVGAPEALTALGRFHETGTGVERDPLKAAEYYLRAYRLGSATAPFLLWDLKETEAFMRLVRNDAAAGDPLAKYVYAGLASAGFVGGLDEQLALQLFESAGDRGHAPSLIALGAAYYTGGAVARDRDRALDYWRRAQALGSEEAAVRILVAETIEGYPPLPNDELIAELERLEERGAILAEIALGYCHEFGVGKPIDKAAAAERYQNAAARGSFVAFEYLKKLYDEVRPNDERFQITD